MYISIGPNQEPLSTHRGPVYILRHNIVVSVCKRSGVLPYKHILKMLGLYLYTLIIRHKSCNILRLLNKLTWKKELQIFVTNYMVFDKKIKTTTTKQ